MFVFRIATKYHSPKRNIYFKVNGIENDDNNLLSSIKSVLCDITIRTSIVSTVTVQIDDPDCMLIIKNRIEQPYWTNKWTESKKYDIKSKEVFDLFERTKVFEQDYLKRIAIIFLETNNIEGIHWLYRECVRFDQENLDMHLRIPLRQRNGPPITLTPELSAIIKFFEK